MKFLRLVAFPFAVIYGLVTSFRNFAYDKGWLSSKSYDIPVICVGNLSVGGTGKSPMIAYLIRLLKNDYKVAVLSRGYKRSTSGYREVLPESTAKEVGDEPLQFKTNFPNVKVAVCANRQEGIEKLKSSADVILLDDAFQHRKVKAVLNILLTPYNDLFIDDYLLPTGMLRESRAGAQRADIIIVTKCPERLAYARQQEIQMRIGLLPHQKLYFSKIGYAEKIYGKSETLQLDYLADKHFTLVTGIANPKPLVDFLQKKQFKFDHEKFPDHHNFSTSEISKLSEKDILLTTEKDYMRLQTHLDKFALYFLPIRTVLFNEQEQFFHARVKEVLEKD